MRDVLLEKVNLNLIPVLRAMLRERSVSRAAAVLGRSPAAISASLAQLREILGDRLLVRVGGHLQLTARAAELAEPVEELNVRLDSLFRSRRFDPTTSDRKFTIASSDLDLVFNQMGSMLVRILRRHASKMALHFVDVPRGLTAGMAAREIDFALLPDFAVAGLAPAPIRFKAFYPIEFKALMSSDHPLARQSSVSKEDLGRYRHVAFRPEAMLPAGDRWVLRSASRPDDVSGGFDVAVTVSRYLIVPSLLNGTDLVAIVPAPIANFGVETMPLIAVDLSYETFKPQMGIAWSPVYDRDEAHTWFRRMIAEQAPEDFPRVQRYAPPVER